MPPIFNAYMVALTSFSLLKTERDYETEAFLDRIQELAEACHRMGVIQNPAYCSIFYFKSVHQYLIEINCIKECLILGIGKPKKAFKLIDLAKLIELVEKLRLAFLWEENYRIIQKVYIDKFDDGKQPADIKQRL